MSYLDIRITKDLLEDLLIEIQYIDEFYLAFPQQLWDLKISDRRLITDHDFYERRLRDKYGVTNMPRWYPYQFVYEDGERFFANDVREFVEFIERQSPHLLINEQLRLFAAEGSLQLVKYAIQKGASVGSRWGGALIKASQGGHLAVVKYLLNHGADVHTTRYVELPLNGAVQNGHLDVVKHLIEKGANVRYDGDLPLQYAINEKRWDVATELILNGADINTLSPEDKEKYERAMKQQS